MNDHVHPAHPDWGADLAQFRAELAAAPAIRRPWNPLIAAAARRAHAWLHDGTQVTLTGIHGNRARIQLPDGRPRTVPVADIAHVENQ